MKGVGDLRPGRFNLALLRLKRSAGDLTSSTHRPTRFVKYLLRRPFFSALAVSIPVASGSGTHKGTESDRADRNSSSFSHPAVRKLAASAKISAYLRPSNRSALLIGYRGYYRQAFTAC